MCKDGPGDSGYDNIFNAICRWPIINCTRLWGFRIHDKELIDEYELWGLKLNVKKN